MSHLLRAWTSVLAATLLCVLGTATGASAQDPGDKSVAYQQLADIQPGQPIQPATASADAGPGALRTRLGDIRLDSNFTLTALTLTFARGRVGLSGGLRVKCPAGGTITLSLAGDLSFVRAGTWSVTAGGRTGPGGCFLIPELGLGSNGRATVTLRSIGGKISAEVDVEGGIELTINRVKLTAKARIAASTRGGPFEISFSGGFDGEIVPGLTLGRVAGTIENNQIAFRGAIRFRCQTGWLEAGIEGAIARPDRLSGRLYAKGGEPGANQPCVYNKRLTLVESFRLDADTFEGSLTASRSNVSFDAKVGVGEIDLGEWRVPFGDRVGFGLGGKVQLTNSCSDCQPDRIRLIVDGTAWSRIVSAGLPYPMEVRLDAFILVDVEWPTFFPRLARIEIKNVRVNGVPTGLVVVLAGELQRRIEDLFDTGLGRASGTGGRCADVTCTNAVSAHRESTTGAAGSRDTVTSTRKARIRSVRVRSSGSRLRISVRTSVPVRVNVEMQRRRCMFERCRWELAAYRQVVTSARGVAVVNSKAGMKRGRYRVLVRLGSNRKSRPVIRSSRIG